LVSRLRKRRGSTIRTVACDRVERVGDREDPRVEMYLLALQTRRVAASVKPLVMLRDNRTSARKKIDVAYYSKPRVDMSAHLRPFFFGQGSLLQKDGIADSYLADVVEQRPLFEREQLEVTQTQLSSEPQAVSHHAVRVTASLAVPGLER